jgi:anti-sigma B factor antagonist
MASEPFSVVVRQAADVQVVALSGELDLATSQGLPDTLNEIAGPTVVVDLAGLSFVDSSGITALVLARQRIEGRGSSFVLTRPQEQVAKTFEIIGLAQWMAPWSTAWE